ncbi:MAG: hypothetical protein LBQ58_09615 [Synergistaceae bacterium]|nr:hypothetical protein [Synergistaceae bacterium]
MKATEIEEIVYQVLKRMEAVAAQAEMPIKIEASARHVHLNADAVSLLFGKGAVLQKARDLSQPGEFLAKQRVKLVTAGGEISNVAVLGPPREVVQVELSRTDSRVLGLDPPLNISGDLSGACDVFIVGDNGMIDAKGSVIIAKAHAHLRPQDALACGLSDGSHARIAVKSRRPVVLGDVIVRVRDTFSPAVHIDFDEANACMLESDSQAYILCGDNIAGDCRRESPAPQPEVTTGCRDESLITESMARDIVASCAGSVVKVGIRTILTPSAKDVFYAAKKSVTRI